MCVYHSIIEYMKLNINPNQYIDTEIAFDLSIPINAGTQNVNAWYCDPVEIVPVMNESFTGDTTKGGAVNFKGITINPHGNGTHTECVGHISTEGHTINQCLKSFHFFAQIVTVKPKNFHNEKYQVEDTIIDEDLITEATKSWTDEKAIVIRTAPNGAEKKEIDYSGKNATYFTTKAIEHINNLGIHHLMVDLPSVDRELDEGRLEAHHLFWDYPNDPQTHKTISELLYIPNEIKDGRYLIQIQIMSIENDASPSKIMAHPIFDC